MKIISLRLPEEILDWLREKSAMETIKRKKYFSMNSYIVDLLQKAMEADHKKEE